MQLQEGQSKSHSKKVSESKIRNRRFKKLKQLRENGFFSEEAIKLRHPLLYHNYLGKHSQRITIQKQPNCTLSQFLQKNLMNLQYKRLLNEQLNENMIKEEEGNNMMDEGKNKRQTEDEEKEWCLLSEEMGQIVMEPGKNNTINAGIWETVQQEEIELQQENLIDHAQQLFLSGQVDAHYVNYQQIDNNSDNDEIDMQNRDAEQKYFQTGEDDDAEVNKKYYTGIQDY